MKIQLTFVLIFLLLSLLLTACGCKHEAWDPATCDTPKICAECGEADGAPLGHVWKAATCEIPKTCEVCGTVDGQATGHTWADAACDTPKTCTTCKLTEGTAPGHQWEDATTEAPKTCAVCHQTEGERIVTDSRFTTAATRDIQGQWSAEISLTGDMMGLPDFNGILNVRIILEFGSDGTMRLYTETVDPDEFRAALIPYYVQMNYDLMAQKGYSREETDALFLQTYGISVEEYVRVTVASIDFDSLLGISSFTGVYYVSGDEIFGAEAWSNTMEPIHFALSGDKLTIDELITPGQSTELTRVSDP